MVAWTRQLGTSQIDASYGVSADGLGNVYISGYTGGSLGGPSAGLFDAFVSKYDAAGALQWNRQLGTYEHDDSLAVSADGLGNVYIATSSWASLGGPSAGGRDTGVSKYDAAGALQWTRQLGTAADDYGWGVSADGLGNVYLSGYTTGNLGGPNAGGLDTFVSKYDAAGALQWTRQLGTASDDRGFGVSADGLGNVYISGYTGGSLGGPNAGPNDAFVSKYDAAGALQWTQQLGTAADDYAWGVSADGLGNVYLSGYTTGNLGGPNAGGLDAFVSKYDAAGALQWMRQLGTAADDLGFGVSADGLGNVYISGYTGGSLGGPNAGPNDAFVSKYDAAGALQWTQQLGTAASDVSRAVSADGLGNVYLSGQTAGSLGGPFAGGEADAFVSKLVEVPHVLAGDYNADGFVDAADYVVWRKNEGTMNTLPNDPTGGTIGAAQYNAWRTNFGQPSGSGSGASVNAAIPEPATAVLLMFAAAALCLRRSWATQTFPTSR